MPYYPPPSTSTSGSSIPLANFQAVNNNSTVQYWLIATLPATSLATLDSIYIQATTNDTWGAADSNELNLILGNRGAFAYKATVQGYVSQNAGIRCYLESGGTVSVYAYLKASTFSYINLSILNADISLGGGPYPIVYSTPTLTTSPTGTLNYDSTNAAIYPPVMCVGASSTSATTTGNTLLLDASGGRFPITILNTTNNGFPDYLVRRSGTESASLLSGANFYLSNSTSNSSVGIQNYAGNMQFFSSTAGSNTEKMRLDSNGNLGVDVTPSAWGATLNAIDLKRYGGFFADTSGNFGMIGNAYYDGANFKYKNTAYAGIYEIINSDGTHRWYTAPSGTAGGNITFTQALTLFQNGNYAVGYTSDQGQKLQVNGRILAGSDIDVGGAAAISAQGAYLQWNRNAGDGATWIANQKGGGSGGIIFGSATTGNVFSEYMRLEETQGNLLIGTSSNTSGYKLQVNGPTYSAGNVGVGVTVDPWFTASSSQSVIQMSNHVALSSISGALFQTANFYSDGTNFKYATTGPAGLFEVTAAGMVYNGYNTQTAGTVATTAMGNLGLLLDSNGLGLAASNTVSFPRNGQLLTVVGNATFQGLQNSITIATATSLTVTVNFGTIIHNTTSTTTLTLPAAGAAVTGMMLYIMNQVAGAVNSASSNVIPAGSSTAGTAILAATAGKWCMMQHDGTNWRIIMNN